MYKRSSQKVQHGRNQNNEDSNELIHQDKDGKGKSIDSTMYRGMIGSLLYLTVSRPDIMYSVRCDKFQSCPKESHLSVVKRILRYLKGTIDIGLWYPKSDNFELIGFSNADFFGCRVERKNISDTCHFLGHSLVSCIERSKTNSPSWTLNQATKERNLHQLSKIYKRFS